MWSRRRVLGGSIVAAGALFGGAGWAAVLRANDDGRPVRYFDVVHDAAVYVTMDSGESFAVVVKASSDGAELERHEGVTARTLLDLDSAYVQIAERT